MRLIPKACAALLLFALAGCVRPQGDEFRPSPPVLILGAAVFLPGGAPDRESLAQTAVAAVPTPGGYAMKPASDAQVFMAFCAAADTIQKPDLGLTGRHPSKAEIAACAARGIALTSVKLAAFKGPEPAEGPMPDGAFIVYDAAHDRPEAHALIAHILENRVALFTGPGYAELYRAQN